MSDELTEVHADGREYIVPQHLWCRAPALVIKDETLRWVSTEEACRLDELLTASFDTSWGAWFAGQRNDSLVVPDVFDILTNEGYTKSGVTYTSPDEWIVEQHYLFRDQHGAHVVIVFVLWDEGGVYLHHTETSIGDVQDYCRILRLERDSDIKLARRHRLLCEDTDGPHVQVQCWRSIIWQCTDEKDQLDEERLREFWRRCVRELR